MSGVQSRGSPKRRIFRKVRRYLLHYILLAAFCLAIAFIMCYTVFFKLDKIKISGCTVYSETQIVDEIGAEKGESLFKINISNAEKKLVGKLPYIRSVKISRQFPTTLKVEIEEEEILGAVYTDEGFAILSTTGKVLETGVLALSEGIPQIVGITGQTYSTGSYVRESSNLNSDLIPQIQALQTVQQELKNNDFNDITYYDVTDMLNIKVMIEDRLLMKLGTNIDMDYKIHFIKGVLDGKESGDEEFENVPEEGTLDFSDPPALHTMSIDIDKVKNEDAYHDFGVEKPPVTDNIVGGEESEPMQTLTPSTQEGEESTEQTGQEQTQEQTGEVTQPEEQSQQESAEQTDTQPEQTQDSGETQETEQQTAPQAQTQTDIPKASPQVNEVNGVVQNTGGQTSGTQSSAAQPSTGSQTQQTGNGQAQDQTQSQNQSGSTQTGGNVFNSPSSAPIVN